MHSRFRAKGVTLTVLVALFALLAVPGALVAKPRPGEPGRGFRLQARATGAITVNRVYCGIAAGGEVCVDSLNSSTIGGGYWPKGSPMQYVFNSGLQAAGIIDAASTGAWAGDTVGALFFSARGGNQGSQVEPIWNSSDAGDKATWPAAGMVPQGDAVADLFNVNLQGRLSASEGDIWTLAWDGDPSAGSGRTHPMGIAVETRGLGWNFPTGNEDIVYFIYTFYNISSSCAADYVSIRPALRGIMQTLGTQFQTLNNAASNTTLPACGYTINNFYANFAADMDVADAGLNYASVNIPFALGYAYEDVFDGPPGSYRLPADVAKPGFLPGFGFVGVKYLKSPVVAGAEVGISLFSNTTNGGAFPDPNNSQQLWRYLSGNISAAQGDGSCNYNPLTDKICFINKATHSDVRFYQSSGPFDLAPGQFGSIVVGYLFASAVAVPGCPTAGCTAVKPGEPLALINAATLAANGANLIDSLTGFNGYSDLNGDSKVTQDEFTPVKGSLLDKALVAQAVFNSGFLLPSPPTPPEFFLVPGSNQVAVFWRPSVTEATGDLYFNATSQPLNPDLSVNALYDPNYRNLDVEGYRIYRGRVDDPRSLTLLAQYDLSDTKFTDYLGVINPTPDCAPELRSAGEFMLAGCPVAFDTAVAAGTAYTTSTDYDIVSPFIQVKLGDRTVLANGDALVIKADTAVTGALTVVRGTELKNSGDPLVYVDKTARNNIRYFYTVSAFDVNSIQSGPTSLESARVTKSATPVLPAGNYDNAGAVSIGMFGRGVNMTVAIPRPPSLNSTTGRFSGPARPATGAAIGFVGDFVKQVVTQSGEMSLTLLSMTPGSAYRGVAATYTFQVIGQNTDTITVSIAHGTGAAGTTESDVIDGGPINDERGQRYGGSNAYHLAGSWSLEYVGSYLTNIQGRGCANADADLFISGKCEYNGARWFDGANETFDHPTRGNTPNNSGGNFTLFTNAGSVAGVANIWEPRSYETRPNFFRQVEGVFAGAATAADYRLFWGAAGAVDSVVDITHNVLVPFDAGVSKGYTWGFLTTAGTAAAGSADARPGVLSTADLGCVVGIKGDVGGGSGAGDHLACGAPTYSLTSTVSFGPVAMANTVANDGAVAARPNPGFGIYMPGHFFLIEMAAAVPTAPVAGTVWTLRTYTGSINGGGGTVGTAGNDGAYAFIPQPSPFTAVTASLKAAYTVTNALRSTSDADLSRVHTVPDPYYVMNGFERTATGKVIKFVNLPDQAVVRIYSVSGVLVRVLEHTTTTFNGSMDWDVRNRNNQVVASGVYFYHIESPSGARRVGRMTIINFAQ